MKCHIVNRCYIRCHWTWFGLWLKMRPKRSQENLEGLDWVGSSGDWGFSSSRWGFWFNNDNKDALRVCTFIPGSAGGIGALWQTGDLLRRWRDAHNRRLVTAQRRCRRRLPRLKTIQVRWNSYRDAKTHLKMKSFPHSSIAFLYLGTASRCAFNLHVRRS